MQNIIDIKSLTREEKIQIMEALWDDLTHDSDAIKSPNWHEDELRKTKKKLASGKEETVDWNEAKENLRKRF